MLTLLETIRDLSESQEGDNDSVRVQVDGEGWDCIFPIQSIEVGVDGRVYIRCIGGK